MIHARCVRGGSLFSLRDEKYTRGHTTEPRGSRVVWVAGICYDDADTVCGAQPVLSGGHYVYLASSCRQVDTCGDVCRGLPVCRRASPQAPVPGPVPLQRKAPRSRLEHVYVIPDFKMGMVPNVGIIVGSRATLVVDPGMASRTASRAARSTEGEAGSRPLHC